MKTFQEFIAEAIKGWKHADRDITAARANASLASSGATLHTLKKADKQGNREVSSMVKPMGFKSSEYSGSALEQAVKKHNDIVGFNPGKVIAHELRDDSGKKIHLVGEVKPEEILSQFK